MDAATKPGTRLGGWFAFGGPAVKSSHSAPRVERAQPGSNKACADSVARYTLEMTKAKVIRKRYGRASSDDEGELRPEMVLEIRAAVRRLEKYGPSGAPIDELMEKWGTSLARGRARG
jgi:hypothetical protein